MDTSVDRDWDIQFGLERYGSAMAESITIKSGKERELELSYPAENEQKEKLNTV